MMQLAEAAAALGGHTSGADVLFTGVSTDSRSLRARDLFVALRGERFDGHDFLKPAAEASAAAAMVDAAYRGEYPLPVLVVRDTRRSLGDLARYWRARFAPSLVAIAGSFLNRGASQRFQRCPALRPAGAAGSGFGSGGGAGPSCDGSSGAGTTRR